MTVKDDVLGYDISPSDSVCADDAPPGFAAEDYSDWKRPPGWGPEPSVLDGRTERDSPVHCDVCGRLIPCPLSASGLDDVSGRIGSGLGDVAHDVTALSAWWDEYGEHLDEDQLRDIITEALGQRANDRAALGSG